MSSHRLRNINTNYPDFELNNADALIKATDLSLTWSEHCECVLMLKYLKYFYLSSLSGYGGVV